MGTSRARRKPSRSRPSVADALFTKGQQRVLGVLFGNPHRSFYANEIIALAGMGTGVVQRELSRLESAGLVTVERVGRQKHYQANADASVFAEVRALVLKTSGLADVLKEALAPLADDIRAAFIFGSVARQEDTAASDVDVMVVSDTLTYAELFGGLAQAEGRLGRRVNPTVYAPADLERRIREENSFIGRVLEQPKIWLIGEERDLAA